MYCPNCGTEISLDRRFCRSCGMSLEAISKALADHLSLVDPDKSVVKTDERLILHRMYRFLLWGIIAILAGMALVAIGKKNDLISLPGLFVLFAGVLITAYGVLSPLKAKALSSSQDSLPKGLPHRERRMPLLSEHQKVPMPSVTEGTTELLEDAGSKSTGRI